jgi:hypothetical protein
LAAVDGMRVRCLVLYFEIEDYALIVGEYGKLKKLKGKRPQKTNVITKYHPEDGFSPCFVRFFKATDKTDLMGITWTQLEGEQFLKFEIKNPGGPGLTTAWFWKNRYDGKSCTTLIFIDVADSMKAIANWKDVLLQTLLNINNNLLGETLVICDDVLPGYEKEAYDFMTVYRNVNVPFFLC